ncbi:hypothetical protein ACJW30_11G136000 [Castanea mollissima]
MVCFEGFRLALRSLSSRGGLAIIELGLISILSLSPSTPISSFIFSSNWPSLFSQLCFSLGALVSNEITMGSQEAPTLNTRNSGTINSVEHRGVIPLPTAVA